MKKGKKEIFELKKERPRRSTMMMRPFRRIGSLLPPGILSHFERKLKFAGIRIDARVWLGIRMIFSLIMGSLLLLFYLSVANPLPTNENIIFSVGLFLGGALIAAILFYLLLFFEISDRSSALEKILPDFLLLIVSNLRAGMTPTKAFMRAVRPEFGALYNEMKFSAVNASGTSSVLDAMEDAGNYFDSRVFRRIIALFGKGMRAGGQLAPLLRSCADEVQHIQDLRAELAAATKTYTLFLGFITIIIMPFLLSVSTLFVEIFLKLQPDMDGFDQGMVGSIPMFSGKIFITPNEMITISILTLVLTSLLVSGLAGIIRKGRALYGLKYFPIFAFASVVSFFIAHTLVKGMLMNFST